MTKEIKKFSKEEGNLEVIKEIEKPTKVGRDAINNKQGNNIVIGTLNVITTPLKKRHEKHYKESTFHLIVDIVLVFAVIVMAISVYIIRNMDLTRGIDLEIRISDEQVVSTDHEIFEFYYSNNTHDKITNVSYTIKLPPNFVIDEVSPKNLYDFNKHTFSLGDMENGANGSVRISGIIYGTVGNQQLVSSSFNFEQKGNKRNVLRSLHYSVDDSLLDITVNLPREVFAGAVFQGNAVIRNNSQVNLDNISLQVNSQGLDFKGFECGDCGEQENLILINYLAAGAERTVVFEAIARDEGDKKVSFNLALQRGVNSLIQGSEIQLIATRKPKLKIQALSDKEVVLNCDKLNYDISIVNEEIELIENLEIKILPNNKNFRISKLKLVSGADIEFDNNIIKLGTVGSQTAMKLSVDVEFLKITKALEQNFGLIFDTSYDLGSNLATLRSFSPVTKVLSAVNISSGGYYYSRQGDQLGIGPVPPIVGIPTTYWVFWDVDNYGNDLGDFRLSGKLSPDVVFTGNKTLSAGNLKYNESNGMVEWTVALISREGGNSRVGFELSQTPDIIDAGKVLDLLSDIKYFYNDNFCETPKTGTLMKINTRLENDKNLIIDGVVQVLGS